MAINPVRYPGGKGSKKIVDRILSLYPKDYFQNKVWVEPFCGGCGLGLSLLERNIISKAIFNDNDPRIYAMWNSIAYHSDQMIEDIQNLVIDMDLFRKAKRIANDESSDIYERGLYTYCLNRMCRSGYIDGGVIGGNEQKGNYKCDCRFNKNTLTKHIEKIGNLTREGKIVFTSPVDAIDFLLNENNKYFDDDAFLYIDPPYYKMGAKCYREGIDHKILADVLLKKQNENDSGEKLSGSYVLSNEWLLSYDDCDEIRNLYGECESDFLEVIYSNNSETRGKASELLIFSPGSDTKRKKDK